MNIFHVLVLIARVALELVLQCRHQFESRKGNIKIALFYTEPNKDQLNETTM